MEALDGVLSVELLSAMLDQKLNLMTGTLRGEMGGLRASVEAEFVTFNGRVGLLEAGLAESSGKIQSLEKALDEMRAGGLVGRRLRVGQTGAGLDFGPMLDR